MSVPRDCAATGAPTISRVKGCINDEMRECIVCKNAVVHDLTEHPLFGFKVSCPYADEIDKQELVTP
jgi:hypothetical protein